MAWSPWPALDLQKAAPERAGRAAGAARRRRSRPRSSTPFCERKNGAALLAAALADKKLPPDVAKVGVRAVRISGRDAPALIDALTKAGGLTFGARGADRSEMKADGRRRAKHGRPGPRRGIFRRKDMVCLKCHAIAGAGGQVGPDLTSIGASAQVDYLIESILLPNKAGQGKLPLPAGDDAAGPAVHRHQGARDGRRAGAAHRRGQGDRHPHQGHRRADNGRLADAGRSDRHADPRGAGGSGALPVGAGQGRSVLGEQGPAGAALAGAGADAGGAAALPGVRSRGRARRLPGLAWEPAYSTVAGVLPLEDMPRWTWARKPPRQRWCAARWRRRRPARWCCG